MIYKNWMQYVKDDVKLVNLVMPSSHNAGSFGMNVLGCCQDGDLYTQFAYGVRHFCLRLNTNRKGKIVLSHGLAKGAEFETQLEGIKHMLETNDSEFFIFDIREYYPQKIGPKTFISKADPVKLDELFAKYIEPEKYSYTDFENISDVTIGDLRHSGKRYILLNYAKAYKYSTNCPCVFPWSSEIHGKRAEVFSKECLKFIDTTEPDGLFWFQTQQTPNFHTEVGIVPPRKLDEGLRPYFKSITDAIAGNPEYLKKINIISGDFMTYDYMKSHEILALNVLKGNIKDELVDEYKSGLEA